MYESCTNFKARKKNVLHVFTLQQWSICHCQEAVSGGRFLFHLSDFLVYQKIYTRSVLIAVTYWSLCFCKYVYYIFSLSWNCVQFSYIFLMCQKVWDELARICLAHFVIQSPAHRNLATGRCFRRGVLL